VTAQQAIYLFHEPGHLLLQSKRGWHVFEWREINSEKVFARIHFNFQSGVAQSALRAPFGSVEVFKKVGEGQIKNFLSQVEAESARLKIRHIVIRNFPDLYNERAAHHLHSVLINLNFKLTEEVSSIIQVDGELFEKKIKASERQKLKKTAGLFDFEQLEIHDLKRVYSFISQCRHERAQSLSMTLRDLQKTISVFPDRFFLFRVGTESEIVAAAIVIRVSNEVLYTFYYAHAQKYNRLSPVVYLISGIYDFATHHKYKMIDLGTSMIKHSINRSLLHFKKSIGGITSKKFTFQKALS